MFGTINENRDVTIESICGVFKKPVDPRKYKTRRGFVKKRRFPADDDIVAKDIGIRSAEACRSTVPRDQATDCPFFGRLLSMKQGDRAYTILSLIDKSGLSHAVPVTFFRRRGAGRGVVSVSVDDIRGWMWPSVSKYYKTGAVVRALKKVVQRHNATVRMSTRGRSDLLVRATFQPPIRAKWARFLVPGEGYAVDYKGRYPQNVREVNCREAAFSYVYILMNMRRPNRTSALSKLKHLFTT